MEELFGEDLAGDASVERAADLDQAPEEVWRFLVDGDLLSRWMDSPVEIEPKVGGRIEMSPSEGEPVWGTVEELDPMRRIQWSWRTDDGMPTLVEIEVAPSGEGTRITVRETLLPWRISGPDINMSFGVRKSRIGVSLAA